MGRLIERIRDRLRPHDGDDSDPIQHVVVLMFENHSFDQMLGCFRSKYAQLEGVDPGNLRSNKDSTGQMYKQRQHANPVVTPDPMHELGHVRNQLKNGNAGFVSEYEQEYRNTTPEQRQRVMDYFGMGDLPALHELAQHFTICDHWYSSVPGPTWTNRFFVHSGTSMGRVKMADGLLSDPRLYMGYTQDTIYDRLNERKKTWKIYYGDVPQSLVLANQRSYDNRQNYDELEQFFDDVKGPAATFPDFVFIEPRYFHCPLVGKPQNDDHPPHATLPAQELLADVYNCLRGNDELWNRTLLVVLYDEHGGFYDHVVPPSAVAPDGHLTEYSFDQLGVRVPAILASPWVEQRVVSTPFDHTSLLRYLIDKWNLRPLTKRSDAANSIRDAISVSGTARAHTPRTLPKPHAHLMAAGPSEAEADQELNDHQKALREFSKILEAEVPVEARTRMMATAASSEGDRARQRVKAFLQHGKSSAQ